MKKVKFLLPVVAIMFAVIGVFATGNSELLVTDNVTTQTSSPCTLDGTCSGTAGNCQLNTGVIFYKIVTGSPTTCSVQSTAGLFSE